MANIIDDLFLPGKNYSLQESKQNQVTFLEKKIEEIYEIVEALKLHNTSQPNDQYYQYRLGLIAKKEKELVQHQDQLMELRVIVDSLKYRELQINTEISQLVEIISCHPRYSGGFIGTSLTIDAPVEYRNKLSEACVTRQGEVLFKDRVECLLKDVVRFTAEEITILRRFHILASHFKTDH
jgi:hypothetical protein